MIVRRVHQSELHLTVGPKRSGPALNAIVRMGLHLHTRVCSHAIRQISSLHAHLLTKTLKTDTANDLPIKLAAFAKGLLLPV